MSPNSRRAGQNARGSGGKKKSVWSVKYKREQYGRRSRTDLEVWHHDGMPTSLDKIARSDRALRRRTIQSMQILNNAYSCRMWTELGPNRLIHNMSCSLSHVTEAGEKSGRWNEASRCTTTLNRSTGVICIGHCSIVQLLCWLKERVIIQ